LRPAKARASIDDIRFLDIFLNISSQNTFSPHFSNIYTVRAIRMIPGGDDCILVRHKLKFTDL